MQFQTPTGATITLQIAHNDRVTVALVAGAKRISGWAERATDAVHGEVIRVAGATIRIPAEALDGVDTVFADAAARVAATKARRAPINAALDKADADYARTARALRTGRA